MEKSEFIDTNNEIINKLKEKFNPQDTVKINLFFHLNEKEIYCYHNEYICTFIIQNTFSSNLYFALKHTSSGEGYIYDKQNNIYMKSHSQMISKLIIDYKNNYLISCSYDKTINIWEPLDVTNGIWGVPIDDIVGIVKNNIGVLVEKE
jgi:WD40 repeat protein